MASTRFTIASNANQSVKTPLLVPGNIKPDPNASNSIRSLVIKTAQSKLRIKKGTRIFLSKEGKELLGEEDWSSLPIDTTLLVSSGEDYVGARKAEGLNTAHPAANPNCPINNLGSITAVDSISLTQLSTTAHTLPGIIHAVGQPDLHPGTKFPIGAVFASRGWIHPPLIGSDIGCGMSWYRTTLSRRNLQGDKAKRISERLRGLEGAWRTPRERRLWLSSSRSSLGDLSAPEPFDASIGTIGAGNHFAEIQIVERADTGVLPAQDSVVLLVHSGSRGYGGHILKRHTANEQTSLPVPSDAATAYLAEHDRACAWARLNRDLIALRFLSLLEPQDPTWALEGSVSDTSEVSDSILVSAIASIKAALADRKVTDVNHNCVSLVKRWPPRSPDDSTSSQSKYQDVYIHRKGAAPSTPDLRETILPLPGSRGTPTILMRPKFSDTNSWGLLNGLSVAHGAGRSMSRAKAAVWVAQKYKGHSENLLRGDDTSTAGEKGRRTGKEMGEAQRFALQNGDDGINNMGGTWVICDEKALVWEEAPESYKDVWSVAADLERSGAAQVVGWARGRISYKIRKE